MSPAASVPPSAPLAPQASPAQSPTTTPLNAPERRCENCGAVLLGVTCHACGQPTKGLVRNFSSIVGDFVDTVFNIDARLMRTLPPLLFKPGYLSQEYFAGHRIRFVSPVRLFVFMAILTFVLAQWAMPDFDNGKSGNLDLGLNVGNSSEFRSDKTVAEVIKRRDQAVAGFDEGIKDGKDVPGLAEGLRAGKRSVQAAAAQRIAELQGEQAPTSGKTIAVDQTESDQTMNFNGKPWHKTKNPLKVDWLPKAGNRWLNELAGQTKGNLARIKKDPNLLKSAVFNALPTTLFILVPVFALLLKVIYVFKRRLYMEHLIVALHSHAFLCLAVITLIAMSSVETWTGDPVWLTLPFGFIQVGLAVWMPLYLLLTQKRIYRQGWPMTLLKFGALGFIHFLLLVFGVAATMMAAMIWL